MHRELRICAQDDENDRLWGLVWEERKVTKECVQLSGGCTRMRNC